MTLLNKSDETFPPSFPLSSLEHNFSIFVTHDPSYTPVSYPTPSSPPPTASNCTSSPSASSPPYNFYAVLLVLLIFCVVFGNVLVCVAVSRERALQTTTNYLIVSLAVSDLLLATLVMPWGVYLEVCVCTCVCLQFFLYSFIIIFFCFVSKKKEKKHSLMQWKLKVDNNVVHRMLAFLKVYTSKGVIFHCNTCETDPGTSDFRTAVREQIRITYGNLM